MQENNKNKIIPIANLIIGETEKRLVNEVLDSGMLAQGPKVEELENKFAEFCGIRYAVAVNSGTSALHTALYAVGLKNGFDEVITAPFTFISTANAILMQGAVLVFADIQEDTFNIDPDKVRDKITNFTKAIIPVDLYGQIYDADVIKEIAKNNNLMVIEDAAQSVNAELNGIKSGNFGDIAIFSFYATKNLISGEGGMVTTNNKDFAERAKMFRNHGQSAKYEYADLGYNYRMTDIHAAIGLGQLEKIDEMTDKRISNAQKLSEGLKNIKGIKIPFIKPNAKHVFHQYTIKVDGFKMSRDELSEKLKEKGIMAGVHYPKPLHLQPCFRYLGYKKGDFPIAERLSEQVLSLPVHPSLSDNDIDYIIETIKSL